MKAALEYEIASNCLYTVSAGLVELRAANREGSDFLLSFFDQDTTD
jgi:hypothetical protein